MLSYRTMAGIGAAALALLALSKVGKHTHKNTRCAAGNYIKKAVGRVEGVIRRRTFDHINTGNDVI